MFDSNDIDDGAVCDDPFKCPPKVAAPRPGGIGKRPRVKSDIKARKRNYWLPKFRKTNRIQGRVRPKPQRPRTNLRRLKTRRGKAQRRTSGAVSVPKRTDAASEAQAAMFVPGEAAHVPRQRTLREPWTFTPEC